MTPKRILSSLVSLCVLGGLAILPGGGCAGPYYIEGQDETGDLPDSLRVLIEERDRVREQKSEAEQQDEGVFVRELGTSAADSAPAGALPGKWLVPVPQRPEPANQLAEVPGCGPKGPSRMDQNRSDPVLGQAPGSGLPRLRVEPSSGARALRLERC